MPADEDASADEASIDGDESATSDPPWKKKIAGTPGGSLLNGNGIILRRSLRMREIHGRRGVSGSI